MLNVVRATSFCAYYYDNSEIHIGFRKGDNVAVPDDHEVYPTDSFRDAHDKALCFPSSMIIVIRGMDNLIILIEPFKALLRSPLMCDSFGKPSVQLQPLLLC